MKKISKADKLAQSISELEQKAAIQKIEIQESFAAISEELRPMNLLKNGVRSVFNTGSKNKEDIFNVLIGIGSGFLSRKLLIGKSSGLLGKTIGRAVQWGMTGIVSKNAESIKEKAGEWIDKIFRKKSPDSNHIPAPHPKTNMHPLG